MCIVYCLYIATVLFDMRWKIGEVDQRVKPLACEHENWCSDPLVGVVSCPKSQGVGSGGRSKLTGQMSRDQELWPSNRFCLSIEDRQQLRKTLEVTVRPPHAYTHVHAKISVMEVIDLA